MAAGVVAFTPSRSSPAALVAGKQQVGALGESNAYPLMGNFVVRSSSGCTTSSVSIQAIADGSRMQFRS